jgi:DNA-binding transcriptional LysR family regulator
VQGLREEEGSDPIRSEWSINGELHCAASQRARPIRVSKGHPDAVRVPATPCELTCYQFINYSQRGGGRPWTFQRSETELLLSPSGRLSVSTMEGVREVVLAGVSAAIACEWTFAPELKSDHVKIVLTDPRLPACELWAVIPAGRMARIKTRVFITFVKEALANANTTMTPRQYGNYFSPSLPDAVTL